VKAVRRYQQHGGKDLWKRKAYVPARSKTLTVGLMDSESSEGEKKMSWQVHRPENDGWGWCNESKLISKTRCRWCISNWLLSLFYDSWHSIIACMFCLVTVSTYQLCFCTLLGLINVKSFRHSPTVYRLSYYRLTCGLSFYSE